MKFSTKKISYLFIFIFFSCSSNIEKKQSPKLVVQITIDQLRGDIPDRFYERFSKKGFRYLMGKGIHFAYANYSYSDTKTSPGHATLVTGTTPSYHGIIAGDWWDYKKNKVIYSLEDSNYPVMDGKGKISKTVGRSPVNLLSSTIGDEIYLASCEKAKIFAVAGKDRASIIPAGRTGKPFWLDKGKFVTSTYYYKKYPKWVVDWNSKNIAKSYKTKKWELLKDSNTYLKKDNDDRYYEGVYKHLGRTMPKSYYTDNDADFYDSLPYTIISDELVLKFSKELIEKENLGKTKGITDYLSISFSSTDYIGHIWGPGSLEAEDNILRIDAILENLFSYLDKSIGLDNVTIVLASDHGAVEIPEYLKELGFEGSMRVDLKSFTSQINEVLQKKFGGNINYIQAFVWPYLYLTKEVLENPNLNVEEIEKETAKIILKIAPIDFATTKNEILTGKIAFNKPPIKRILNSFHPSRSGQIHLAAKQHVILQEGLPSNHGSLWTYDTYVPIMLVGPGIPKGKRIVRPVCPKDIAPTISVYLGIKPPSKATGIPLLEVFEE